MVAARTRRPDVHAHECARDPGVVAQLLPDRQGADDERRHGPEDPHEGDRDDEGPHIRMMLRVGPFGWR